MQWAKEHKVKGGDNDYRKIILIIIDCFKVPPYIFTLTSLHENHSVKFQKSST